MADLSKQRFNAACQRLSVQLFPPTKKWRKDSSQTENPAKSEQNFQRQFVHKWLKEFIWLALRGGKLFCTVCKSAPSLAGRTDFICSVCLSFKRESLVLHYNSKQLKTKCWKMVLPTQEIPYTGWPWLLTLLIVKMNNFE